MTENRVWRLRSRPVKNIDEKCLELCKEAIPTIGDGQLLCKNLYFSIDPTHRIWMSDIPQYMPKVELGEVMRAATVAEVVESKNPQFSVGTTVVAFGGMCDYFVGFPGGNVLYPTGKYGKLPITADLSTCSVIIGLTAWHGVRKILNPTKGDIVVVSGAAGAVGSIVGQLCKVSGATVIGIAGGATKCAEMKNVYGFDHCIDYKETKVEETLKELAPDGVTHYFDNVGGEITDAVLRNARNKMKYALCGSISEYNDSWNGQKNFNMILMRRISVQGFICTDHFDELADATAELSKLANEGKLTVKEDIRDGLENYISVVNLLFSGSNTGKLILKN